MPFISAQSKTSNRVVSGHRSRVLLRSHNTKRRKGSALVFSVFLVAGLLVVTAIAIDFGHINVSRSEMKRTADAAALSACWELFDGVTEGKNATAAATAINDSASNIAAKNIISSHAPILDVHSDVQIGFFDRDDPGALDTSNSNRFNAVRVHVRQTDANESAIPLFFGSVTGRQTQSIQAHSTAALFKTISGFRTPKKAGETLDILPITLDEQTWLQVKNKQTEDLYRYSAGTVTAGGDGYFECSLYPTGTGSPGNRGTVDIGGSNNATPDIRRQILHGISAQDLVDFGRELNFDNQEIELNGDTGISAAIKDDLTQIIGQPRIIPIFRSVQGNGNNAMYKIVAWEGIRILSVRLTGPMNKKHVTIQPCPMIARNSIYSNETVSESEFLFTPVMLVD